MDDSMGEEEGPVCAGHTPEVPMQLQTLRSDELAPGQVLGVYTCPECDRERHIPITTGRPGDSSRIEKGRA